jgi:hypothetical protein
VCPFCGVRVEGAPNPPLRARFSRFAIATGLALAACSGAPDNGDAGEDGGRLELDAGKPDAGPDDDAGNDGGSDAGNDAGGQDLDAGFDAGMIFPPYGAPAFRDAD